MNNAFLLCLKVGTTINTIRILEFYSYFEDRGIPEMEDFL